MGSAEEIAPSQMESSVNVIKDVVADDDVVDETCSIEDDGKHERKTASVGQPVGGSMILIPLRNMELSDDDDEAIEETKDCGKIKETKDYGKIEDRVDETNTGGVAKLDGVKELTDESNVQEVDFNLQEVPKDSSATKEE